jgi:HPt (histidine-containing phosphotransfer) domain-containing protein
MIDAGLIDSRVLGKLAEDVPGHMVPRLIDKFVTEIEQRMSAIEAMLEQESLENLERLAHSIKGSAGTFGAVQLHRCARDLEKSCKDQQSDLSQQQADELLKIAGDTLQAFRLHLASMDS